MIHVVELPVIDEGEELVGENNIVRAVPLLEMREAMC